MYVSPNDVPPRRSERMSSEQRPVPTHDAEAYAFANSAENIELYREATRRLMEECVHDPEPANWLRSVGIPEDEFERMVRGVVSCKPIVTDASASSEFPRH